MPVSLQSTNPVEAKAAEIAAIVTQHAATWTADNAAELAASITALWRGLAEPILTELSEFIRPCKICGQVIYIVRTKTGLVCYSPYGYNHAKECKK